MQKKKLSLVTTIPTLFSRFHLLVDSDTNLFSLLLGAVFILIPVQKVNSNRLPKLSLISHFHPETSTFKAITKIFQRK